MYKQYLVEVNKLDFAIKPEQSYPPENTPNSL